MIPGVIIVNKPQGWTSFDVVAKLRNLTREQTIGHSGTLDPMATGVLPVFIGRGATKYIDRFLSGNKGYLAEMTLGVRTETGDADGQILNPKSEILNNIKIPNMEQIQDILPKHTGEIEQIPPMYSAKKINGQRLYKLARQGKVVERQPRKITIHSLHVSHIELPRVTLEILCSKGTYIRQLVSDIGDDLGCGAHLSKLERTYAEPFELSQSHTMEEIVTLAQAGKLDTIVMSIKDVLDGLQKETRPA